MVDEPHEARAAASRSPLQHLQVAVGIAEGEYRPAADEALDAHGLARPIVDEIDLRQINQRRTPVAVHLELQAAGRTDDLLRRNAVGLLSPGRMKSAPPPEAMKVLKPLLRR